MSKVPVRRQDRALFSSSSRERDEDDKQKTDPKRLEQPDPSPSPLNGEKAGVWRLDFI